MPRGVFKKCQWHLFSRVIIFDDCFNQILFAGGLILTFGRGDLSDIPLFHFQPDVGNLIVDLSAVGKGYTIHRVVDNSFLRISVINIWFFHLASGHHENRWKTDTVFFLKLPMSGLWIKWGYYESSPICSDNQTEYVAVYFNNFLFLFRKWANLKHWPKFEKSRFGSWFFVMEILETCSLKSWWHKLGSTYPGSLLMKSLKLHENVKWFLPGLLFSSFVRYR